MERQVWFGRVGVARSGFQCVRGLQEGVPAHRELSVDLVLVVTAEGSCRLCWVGGALDAIEFVRAVGIGGLGVGVEDSKRCVHQGVPVVQEVLVEVRVECR